MQKRIPSVLSNMHQIQLNRQYSFKNEPLPIQRRSPSYTNLNHHEISISSSQRESSEVDELFTDRHQEQLVQPIIMQQKNNFSSAISEELFKEQQRTIYKMSVQLNKFRILLKHLLSKCDELHDQAIKNIQRIHDIKIIFFK
ncbi:Hypothetical_protein [Hexamita inflata]|uniref:Hypothetical_protein n=1 Tax=Hexamita inflata TaxID=28002 RepID=A0AA86QNG7_9EUKA|nr:Hypothetical protein HINF_LOCUS43914 [Hexamita inflata]